MEHSVEDIKQRAEGIEKRVQGVKGSRGKELKTTPPKEGIVNQRFSFSSTVAAG